jgi:two-component system nitrogen regulation response regulator GlnG
MDAPALAVPPPELVSLLEQLPGCRLLIDRHYRIVATNSTFREHCHQVPGQRVTGRRCYEVSHGYDSPCDQNGEVCPLAAATRSGKTENCLHIHHTPCGPEHVSVEILPLTGASGAVELYMEHMEPLEHSQSGEHCVGRDPSFLATLGLIKRVAPADTSVLLLGETGTGKEVMARALHDLSSRATKPFVVVDCSGLTETLFESELFGHERGAFTGAQQMRRGRFEQAEGGTLFLDEIGDMPAELQTRLLRVLSDGFYYRVGGHQPIKADVRVIAATHQNLEERVRQGLFREDLYHRLNVIRLRLPSLRERREDIPLLAKHFLAKSARELGVEPKKLSEGALQYISQMPFPGNVRQLENLCHWLTVLAPAQVVKVEDLPLAAREGNWLTAGDAPASGARAAAAGSAAAPAAGPVLAGGADWIAQLTGEVERRLQAGVPDVMDALTRDFEAAVIRAALRHTHGRRIDAATRLGVGRNTITRKIQDLKLED